MEQSRKRFRTTKEAIIEDIATSIEDISESIKTIGEYHGALIRTNKALVVFLQHVKKQEESLNISELGDYVNREATLSGLSLMSEQ